MAELWGRERELERIARFIEGDGGVLLLRGEAGIGKTALWAAALDRDLPKLVARPSEGEARLSFAALGDLLGPVAQDVLPALPEPQKHALEVALLLRRPAGRRPDAATVARATLAALRVLAARGPRIVAVDDVQWLDPPSATALAFALRRLKCGLHYVFSERTEQERAPLPLELERSDEPPEVIELGPLSVGALQRVLRARLDVSFPRPTLLRLHETSRGNPLLALEVARALQRRDIPVEPGEPLPVPASVEELVRQRVAELPSETVDALLAVAAAAVPTLDIVPVGPLGPAFDAELLERTGRQLRFSHPLFGAAIYGQAPPHRLRVVHERLAERVQTSEERARHLALAADAPDEHVASILEEAAQQALARGAPSMAADLLSHALRLTGDEAAYAGRAVAAAEATRRAGDAGHAVEIAEGAVKGIASEEARRPLVIWLADATGGLEATDAAIAAAGDDPTLAAAAWNARSETLFAGDDVEGALAAAEKALRHARAADDPAVLTRALAHVGHLRVVSGDPGGVAALGEAAARADERDPLLHNPYTSLAIVALWQDRFDEARRRLIGRVTVAEELGDEVGRATLVPRLARVELWSGNLQRALELAKEGVALVESTGHDEPVNALWVAALVHAHLGDFDDARELAARAHALASSQGDPDHFHVLNVYGTIELHAGDPAAAHPYFARLPDLVAQTGTREPGFCPYHADELETLVRAGDVRAEPRIAETEELGVTLDRPRLLVAARRARALLTASVEDARVAVADAERLEVPLETGRALLVLGAVERRAKRWGLARAALEQAAAEFERIGARAWAERARLELARVGGRAAGSELTQTEQRVAELAAAGRTNKEVAAELFLSVRGVEANLSRVYAKLGIRSRAELAQRLSA